MAVIATAPRAHAGGRRLAVIKMKKKKIKKQNFQKQQKKHPRKKIYLHITC